jgi:hypothetical protein
MLNDAVKTTKALPIKIKALNYPVDNLKEQPRNFNPPPSTYDFFL